MTMRVTILAHNEERRIAGCLRSVIAEPGDFPIHVIVNGSTDRTAEIARSFGGRVTVVAYDEGGKSRSWSRFVLDELDAYADCNIFMDGDAEIEPGSLAALSRALGDDPSVNAASAMPMNGRSVARYRAQMLAQHGLFGDLYALSGGFLTRMRAAGVRLPDDLIGDDGLLCAMAKTDLASETDWRSDRVAVCADAGFYCEPVSLFAPATWRMQYRRMVNYSVRQFQNQMISEIMRGPGPHALPRRMASLYAARLGALKPRRKLPWWWFDRRALQRMRLACA